MRAIFFNIDGTLRSGWRLVGFLVLFFLIAVIFTIPAVKLDEVFQISENFPIIKNLGIPVGFMGFFALIAGWISCRIFESLPLNSLGIVPNLRTFLNITYGILFGAAALAFAVVSSFLFGSQQIAVNNADGMIPKLITLLFSASVFIFGAFSEEVMFRGYFLQTFMRSNLTVFAIALTSLFFGAVHLGNPNVSALPIINTMFAGVVFSAAYMKTRELYFPIAMHFAWNWFQGAIFGINVSGLTEIAPHPILRSSAVGNVILSGGEYGIEGSIFCTISLFVFTAAIWFSPFLKPKQLES